MALIVLLLRVGEWQPGCVSACPQLVTCTNRPIRVPFRAVWQRRDNFMLSHRHLLRQCARPEILRSFSSTSLGDLSAQTKRKGEEEGEGDRSVPSDPSWGVWKKTIGKQFEKPHRPCNWLGGKVVEFVSVWY